MSLITAFPFHAYVGDLKTRKLLESKSGVSLSLLSSDDMERMAFVEVRTRCGHEDRLAPWMPVRRKGDVCATFYDTRMGNFDVRGFAAQPCSTCANTLTGRFGNERCSGHFGFLRMPRRYPGDAARAHACVHVINPHLRDEVEQLLQAKCFFCHRLRVPDFDVERYVQALRLLDRGLVGDALQLLDMVASAHAQAQRQRRSRDANETIINDVATLREHVERVLAHKAPHAATSTRAHDDDDNDNKDEDNNKDEDDNNKEDNNDDDVDNDAVTRCAADKSVMDLRQQLCKQALREFREYGHVCAHCQGISPRITTKHGHLFFHFNKKNAEFNVANGGLTHAQLREWDEANRRHGRSHTYFHTTLVREHVKQLFARAARVLAVLFPRLGEVTVALPSSSSLHHTRQPSPSHALPLTLRYRLFFLDKLLVPPLPLRLSSGVQVSDSGAIAPDEHTRALSDVLGFVEQIETYYTLHNSSTAEQRLVTTAQEVAHEHNLRNLQAKVNEVYDTILDSFAKKEGLFRMHMMGKRVNQACRSVISPDYRVETNEVLLPRPFARSLTFPEQVCGFAPARTRLLKRCVANGPHVYPGATHLELRLPTGETRFVDLDVPELTRRQHASRYFAMAHGGSLIVHRHILDKDRLVFNRQPTLHKVSMMGYRARVLSGLKTLRFHYVNGKSYNADFDGDEMNVHVPQSIEAKAELECLMDADLNYLVPTSGKPIRGLIQDHIVAGVLLTLRDRFLTHDAFVQFAYDGLAPYLRLDQQQQAQLHAGGGGVSTLTELIPQPAVLKPRPLWTGKQLVSLLVRYVTGVVLQPSSSSGVRSAPSHNDGVTLHGTSLIQASVYATTRPEDTVASRRQQHSSSSFMLRDRAGGHDGEYSYGHDDHDAVVDKRSHHHNTTHGQQQHHDVVQPIRVPGGAAADDGHVHVVNSELVTGVLCKNQLGPSHLSIAHTVHEVYGPHAVGRLFAALGRVLTATLQREGFSMGMDDMLLVDEPYRARLLRELDDAPLQLRDDEAEVMPTLTRLATALQRAFVPSRLLRPFPRNQLLLMTASGAKGSNTNAIQMALGLGQQLFDGRRVRRMHSGKTLPAFFAHERRARAFGYAMGRFASGIRPAEYTVHAMAGRDGLIDTAVKTSRSGHLQRCLIKGLESLVVQCDHSVRDANGSVVQFCYGGDGLDAMKASTLHAWELAKDNVIDLGKRYGVELVSSHNNNNDNNHNNNNDGDDDDKNKDATTATAADEATVAQQHTLAWQQSLLDDSARRDPLPSAMRAQLHAYLEHKATFPLFRRGAQVARWARQGCVREKLQAKRRDNVLFYGDVVADVTARRRVRAYADAGEAVGLLAAQAAGEPSTQMTLNTFHSAGATVTHVTEGIPRLRELLIHGSVQHAAVVVPVVKATDADEAALSRLLRAGVAVGLVDCLAHTTHDNNNNDNNSDNDNDDRSATTDVSRSYRYHVERSADGVRLSIALLFSRAALTRARDDMCMSPREHRASFRHALRELAKRIVTTLRGRSTRGDGGGGSGVSDDAAAAAATTTAGDDDEETAAAAALSDDDDDDDDAAAATAHDRDDSNSDNDSDSDDDVAHTRGGLLLHRVTDPAQLSRASTHATSQRHRRHRQHDDDNDDDAKTQRRRAAALPSTSRKRRRRDDDDDNGDDDNDDDSNDDGSDSDSDSDDDVADAKAAARRHKHDDDDDNDAASRHRDDDNNNDDDHNDDDDDYASFAPMHALYGNKKFRVSLTACRVHDVTASKHSSSNSNHHNDNDNDDSDAFIVSLVITHSAHLVAVVPDVVESALRQQTLPSWLPHFAAVSYTRSADDATCGELVFQGATATLRNVCAFVSLFTAGRRCGGGGSGGSCQAIRLREARSTDIQDMCATFGVESAYAALRDELDKLFRRYAVDYHHLSLIADAATHRGRWENFNFTGVIAHSSSPLFQVTFASSRRFLHTALTHGVDDELRAISAAIMVGERPKVGTACVGVSPDTSVLRDIVERNFT